MKFGPPEGCRGLGDTLLFTSICKHQPGKYTIQLPEHKKHLEILFKGLCANVEITDSTTILNSIGEGHYATRLLRGIYGDYGAILDNRPIVLYSDYESEKWTDDLIKKINKPIIFVPNCSAHWHSIRSISIDQSNEIIDNLLLRNYTPIVCSISDNPSINFDKCINLIDLDLKKYICLLRRVGRYVGCNTGDMHLAIAVGALTKVFQPKSVPEFNENDWNYSHPSIKYFYI